MTYNHYYSVSFSYPKNLWITPFFYAQGFQSFKIVILHAFASHSLVVYNNNHNNQTNHNSPLPFNFRPLVILNALHIFFHTSASTILIMPFSHRILLLVMTLDLFINKHYYDTSTLSYPYKLSFFLGCSIIQDILFIPRLFMPHYTLDSIT